MSHRYIIKDFQINNPAGNHMTSQSGNFMAQGPQYTEIQITILTEQFPIDPKLSHDENLKQFLSGVSYDWATPEMVSLALKEKYPEKFL